MLFPLAEIIRRLEPPSVVLVRVTRQIPVDSAVRGTRYVPRTDERSANAILYKHDGACLIAITKNRLTHTG